MKTPMQRMIEAVEKGYNTGSKELWKEWKNTLLKAEEEMIREAFLCGDDSEFHIGVPNINSAEKYREYYYLCK